MVRSQDLKKWAQVQCGYEVDRVTAHQRSGRNQIFVLSTSCKRNLLLKQSRTPIEAMILSNPPPGAAVPLVAEIESKRVLFEMHAHSRTLLDVTGSISEWTLILTKLASKLPQMHGWPIHQFATRVDVAWPRFSTVLWEDFVTFTPAAKQLVALLQERPLLTEAADRLLEASGSSLVHGDLKPDNVLLVGDDIRLIDWELCGLGDPLIDIGAILGMLVSCVVDVPSESDKQSIIAMKTPETNQLAQAFESILRGYSDGGGDVVLLDAVRACAVWLVARAWTISMHERVLGYQARICVVMAHRLLRTMS